jgi:hypothetical protein
MIIAWGGWSRSYLAKCDNIGGGIVLQADLETTALVKDVLIQAAARLENHQQNRTDPDPRAAASKGFHYYGPPFV